MPDQRYVCDCGLAGPMSYFQGECRPGWTHGRLVKITTDEQMREAVADREHLIALLHEYHAELTLPPDCVKCKAIRGTLPSEGQSDVTPRVVTARADVARVEHLQQQMGDEDHG